MKRIIYDVPKWHVLLHREHRNIPAGKDTPLLRLEDELFERLYSGETDTLPASETNAVLRGWGERFHSTCDQLPSFARLSAECRGDAAAAAEAVHAILDEIALPAPDQTSPRPPAAAKDPLRRAVSAACAEASRAVEDLREARDGLSGVALGGYLPGTDGTPGRSREDQRIRPIASLLRDDDRLRRIALLAGRFKRIGASKRRQRVRHGADEIADVEQGAEIGRALPAELSRLSHHALRLDFLRRVLERQVLQYQLLGNETLGRGPLVVALDKSGSMNGERDVWATALALALLEHAHAERRPFTILDFNSRITYEATAEPGHQLPQEALFVSCGGGTSIHHAVERALDLIAGHPRAMRRADVVLVSDGGSDPDQAHALRERARALDVTLLGLAIGMTADSLAPWCDEIHEVLDLSTVDDRLASPLFSA